MNPQVSIAGRGTRLGILVVLLLSLSLNAIPLWWGLPTTGARTWAFDEIPPKNTGLDLKSRHRGRYPPLHYASLRVVYWPVRHLNRAGVLGLGVVQLRTTLQIVGRMLSVLLATLTIYLVYRIGRLLFDRPRTALLAALSAAFVVPFVFFAKTINLEAPYVFWFTLSLLFFVRIQQQHRTLDYLAFGAAMACAVGTKDQAFALYVLCPLVLVVDLYRHKRAQQESRSSLVGTLFDPRLIGGALVAAVLFALIHDLVSDWESFVRHLHIITGKASQPSRMFDHTFRGHTEMLLLAVRHLAFSMGWPLVLAAIAGVVLAVRERRNQLLSLLVFPVSYYFFFIAMILYHRVRYFLPFCIVLAFFAAHALGYLIEQSGRRGRLARVAVTAILVFTFLRPLSLNQEMLVDSRYRVEAWAEGQQSENRVVVIGTHKPRLPRGLSFRSLRKVAADGITYLRYQNADFVVVNEAEAFEGRKKVFMEALIGGDLNYQVLFRERFEPWPFRLERAGLATNLVTVNPTITVLEKVGDWDHLQTESTVIDSVRRD